MDKKLKLTAFEISNYENDSILTLQLPFFLISTIKPIQSANYSVKKEEKTLHKNANQLKRNER